MHLRGAGKQGALCSWALQVRSWRGGHGRQLASGRIFASTSPAGRRPAALLTSYFRHTKQNKKSINALSSLLTSVIQNKKVSTLKLSFPGCASQVVLLLKKKKTKQAKKKKTTNDSEQREKELAFLNNEAAQAGQPGGEHPGSH